MHVVIGLYTESANLNATQPSQPLYSPVCLDIIVATTRSSVGGRATTIVDDILLLAPCYRSYAGLDSPSSGLGILGKYRELMRFKPIVNTHCYTAYRQDDKKV